MTHLDVPTEEELRIPRRRQATLRVLLRGVAMVALLMILLVILTQPVFKDRIQQFLGNEPAGGSASGTSNN
ncbi:hypothetical protein ACXYMO_15000 [Arenibacterium sp. CAU 1754]